MSASSLVLLLDLTHITHIPFSPLSFCWTWTHITHISFFFVSFAGALLLRLMSGGGFSRGPCLRDCRGETARRAEAFSKKVRHCMLTETSLRFEDSILSVFRLIVEAFSKQSWIPRNSGSWCFCKTKRWRRRARRPQHTRSHSRLSCEALPRSLLLHICLRSLLLLYRSISTELGGFARVFLCLLFCVLDLFTSNLSLFWH